MPDAGAAAPDVAEEDAGTVLAVLGDLANLAERRIRLVQGADCSGAQSAYRTCATTPPVSPGCGRAAGTAASLAVSWLRTKSRAAGAPAPGPRRRRTTAGTRC